MGVLSLIRSCRPPVTSITAIRCSLVTPHNLKLTPALTTQLRQFVTSKVRCSSHGGDRHMHITPSRYAWNKYKDAFHFYFMLGMIPGLTIVFLVNVFIGQPKLAPIPAGYVPQEHEYHKHPITRFMMKYFFTGHQEDYERNLFYMHENDEMRKMRLLGQRVEDLMEHRGDYPNYYVNRTIMGRYFRSNVYEVEKLAGERGLDTANVSIPDPKY